MPTQPAALKTMRLKNFRLEYMPAALVKKRRTVQRILLNGVDVTKRARRGTITVHDVINDQPNTCALIVNGGWTYNYPSVVLADGPTAYWRLGEWVGPTGRDEVGGHRPVTFPSSHITYRVPGAFADGNTGIATDGALTAAISIPQYLGASLVPGATVSFEWWFKPQPSGTFYCGLIGAGGGGNGIYWNATNMKVLVNRAGGDVVNTTALTAGQLYHVVVSINAGAITFYLNGVADGTGTGWTGTAAINALCFAGGGSPILNLLDDVAIYPTALTAAQVQAHYAARTGVAIAAPQVSQSVRITVGSDPPRLLHSGTLDSANTTYEGKPPQTAFPCTGIDDGSRAKRRLPFGTWTNVSATTVAQNIISSFMPGFSSAGVQAGLPLVSINLDGSEGIDGAFKQLARLIGGYFFFEDLVVYLFNAPGVVDLPDAIDNTPGRFLDSPPIKVTFDDTQLVTRYYGKGHAEQLLADTVASEPTLPVSNAAAWFNPSGGRAISDTQRIAYTGVDPGGAGSLVGPGASPSTAPTVVAAGGSGLGQGTYKYAYTDVTAGGESLPSPLGTVLTGTIAAPTVAPLMAGVHPTWSTQSYIVGDTYEWAYQYDASGSGGEGTGGNLTACTALSPISAPWVATQGPAGPGWGAQPHITGPYATNPAVKAWELYERHNGGPWYTAIANANHSAGGTWDSNYASWGPNSLAPPTPNPVVAQAAVSGIAIGASGTTQRKLYRTAVNASQLKFVGTIPDNSTTAFTDATPDASLGANAPTNDTSGLTGGTGQVLAGSTTMVVASTAPFRVGGGWAIIGNGTQLIRYAGISGNTLTGIPATGPGSIVATVNYSSTITGAPSLTGVTGLTVALFKGASINIFVQRDDTAAQSAAAARENDGTGGIHEDLVVDERRNEASLTALLDANLKLFAYPLATVIYATRDMKTKSGKPVTVNLVSPAIQQTLTIQEVSVTEIGIVDGLAPKYLVTASTVRFSLEYLLQQMAANL